MLLKLLFFIWALGWPFEVWYSLWKSYWWASFFLYDFSSLCNEQYDRFRSSASRFLHRFDDITLQCPCFPCFPCFPQLFFILLYIPPIPLKAVILSHITSDIQQFRNFLTWIAKVSNWSVSSNTQTPPFLIDPLL